MSAIPRADISINFGNVDDSARIMKNADVRVTNWGKREVNIGGKTPETEQWVSLDSFAKEIQNFASRFDVKEGYRGLSLTQRYAGNVLTQYTIEKYASADAQLSEKNIIVRIFSAIGKAFQKVAAFFKFYTPRMYVEKHASDVFMMFTQDELNNVKMRVPRENQDAILTNLTADARILNRLNSRSPIVVSQEALKRHYNALKEIRPGSVAEGYLYPNQNTRAYLQKQMGSVAGLNQFNRLVNEEKSFRELQKSNTQSQETRESLKELVELFDQILLMVNSQNEPNSRLEEFEKELVAHRSLLVNHDAELEVLEKGVKNLGESFEKLAKAHSDTSSEIVSTEDGSDVVREDLEEFLGDSSSVASDEFSLNEIFQKVDSDYESLVKNLKSQGILLTSRIN